MKEAKKKEIVKTTLIILITVITISSLFYIFFAINKDSMKRSEICQDMFPDQYSYDVYFGPEKYNCCYQETIKIDGQYSNEKVCVAMKELKGFE